MLLLKTNVLLHVFLDQKVVSVPYTSSISSLQKDPKELFLNSQEVYSLPKKCSMLPIVYRCAPGPKIYKTDQKALAQ